MPTKIYWISKHFLIVFSSIQLYFFDFQYAYLFMYAYGQSRVSINGYMLMDKLQDVSYL
jgi:hypothetical protein